jgi:8-oxo-dGTP diphosphatase
LGLILSFSCSAVRFRVMAGLTRQQLRKIAPYRQQRWSPLDRWDRATPAVDCVLVTVEDRQVRTLLYRRPDDPDDPEAGKWAVPGVLMRYGERYEDEVNRALKDKGHVGVPDSGLLQVESWNYPDRDPRGWVITVLFLAVSPAAPLRRALTGVPEEDVTLASIDMVDLEYAHVTVGDQADIALAYDHNQLVAHAVRRLRLEMNPSSQFPYLLDLMPDAFTLRELQETYEAVIGRMVNTDAFRRSVTKTAGIVEPTGRYRATFGRKAAELYRRAA